MNAMICIFISCFKTISCLCSLFDTIFDFLNECLKRTIILLQNYKKKKKTVQLWQNTIYYQNQISFSSYNSKNNIMKQLLFYGCFK